MADSATIPDEPERWLSVPGYEGLYDVSDLGHVRSVLRQTGRGVRGGHLMSLFPYGRGRHLAARLSRNGENRTWYVHVLVMLAFVGPKSPGQHVRHGPGGKYDNRLVNLLYGTKVENEADKLRDGTLLCGEAAPWSKLTQADVDSIRSRYDSGGESLRALGIEFDVRASTISKIVKGDRWRTRAEDMAPRIVSALPEYVPEIAAEPAEPEHWLPVPTWEGFYEVSDLGRVRSVRRSTISGWRGGRILRPAPDSGGYLIVTFVDGPRRKETLKVHKLVMAAFVGPAPAGQVVRHGPNGKRDNRPCNLSHGTWQDNSDDQLRDGTRLHGATAPRAKLSWDSVHAIRTQFSTGTPMVELAATYGVTRENIRFIVTGKTWRFPPTEQKSNSIQPEARKIA